MKERMLVALPVIAAFQKHARPALADVELLRGRRDRPMICEKCLRLWIEYADVTTTLRTVTRDQSLRLSATEAWKAVSEAIRIHDVMAHPETHAATINPSADIARAMGA